MSAESAFNPFSVDFETRPDFMTSAPSPCSPSSTLVSVRWSGGRHGKPPETDDRRAGLSNDGSTGFRSKKTFGRVQRKRGFPCTPPLWDAQFPASPDYPFSGPPLKTPPSRGRLRHSSWSQLPPAKNDQGGPRRAAGFEAGGRGGRPGDLWRTSGLPRGPQKSREGTASSFLLPTLPPRPSPTTLLAPSSPSSLLFQARRVAQHG